MSNRKSFTLLKLLVIFVIIIIGLILFVPKVLNIINTSIDEKWENNTRVVEVVIETNVNVIDPLTNVYKISLSNICTQNVEIDLKDFLDVEDMNIVCDAPTLDESRYVFKLIGKNKFNGKRSIIKCNENADCEITSIIVDNITK